MYWYIAAWVAGLILAVASMRPVKQQSPVAASLDAFTAPTAEAGREIPVVFGTRDIKSANVVWYGHLKVAPIKKKGGKKG